MEKELSRYLQNFAIQSQLSKRCASYPTLPYPILLPENLLRSALKGCPIGGGGISCPPPAATSLAGAAYGPEEPSPLDDLPSVSARRRACTASASGRFFERALRMRISCLFVYIVFRLHLY